MKIHAPRCTFSTLENVHDLIAGFANALEKIYCEIFKSCAEQISQKIRAVIFQKIFSKKMNEKSLQFFGKNKRQLNSFFFAIVMFFTRQLATFSGKVAFLSFPSSRRLSMQRAPNGQRLRKLFLIDLPGASKCGFIFLKNWVLIFNRFFFCQIQIFLKKMNLKIGKKFPWQVASQFCCGRRMEIFKLKIP